MDLRVNVEMNPHSVLAVIEPTAYGDSQQGDWITVTSKIQNVLSKEEGVEILAAGVFLIPLKNGLKALNCVMDLARDYHFPCKAVFLQDEPKWIHYRRESK